MQRWHGRTDSQPHGQQLLLFFACCPAVAEPCVSVWRHVCHLIAGHDRLKRTWVRGRPRPCTHTSPRRPRRPTRLVGHDSLQRLRLRSPFAICEHQTVGWFQRFRWLRWFCFDGLDGFDGWRWADGAVPRLGGPGLHAFTPSRFTRCAYAFCALLCCVPWAVCRGAGGCILATCCSSTHSSLRAFVFVFAASRVWRRQPPHPRPQAGHCAEACTVRRRGQPGPPRRALEHEQDGPRADTDRKSVV